MRIAIYPGTFDPPTLGHLDIAKRGAKMFDRLIIAIGTNPQKEKAAFSVKERVELWKKCTKGISNIEVVSFSGLLVDFAKKKGAKIILRAIRNIMDFESETVQGQMNRMLSDVETLYLVVDEKYRMISSTLVKEIASEGKKLDSFVPKEIAPLVLRHFK